MLRPIGVILCILGLAALQGCSDQTPIQVGFIAGTSGRVADLGIDGRNGAILATEQLNAAGGINGRTVELIIRDDQQNTELAQRHTQEFIDLQVEAIIGPMTSAMAMVAEPIATQAETLMIGATITTNQLSGKDDYFFRTLPATNYLAAHIAQFQLNRQIESFAIALDSRNLAYTKDWSDDFIAVVKQGGGQIKRIIHFESSENAPFSDIAKQLLEDNPAGVILICNSVDAALLAQNIRKLDKKVSLAASEWAGTERLIQLGGKSVEGLAVDQFMDRSSTLASFQNFSQQYLDRFNKQPGFAALTTYNATRVLFETLNQQHDNETLKQTLLRVKRFTGVQEPIIFDAYGDTRVRTYTTLVTDGQFRVVK